MDELNSLLGNLVENELYADGGVIKKNPSPWGGMWAYRILQNGQVIKEDAQTHFGIGITNNVTELMALVNGLENLPQNWIGIVYSDSLISLGRLFLNYKLTGIPPRLVQRMNAAKKRLINFSAIHWVLLQGHPTKTELANGVGKSGHRVSLHNVWCDEQCKRLALAWIKENLP